MAPQVNATHRCLHEQLLAAEAARGTLVLDVQNVRDHVRSRAARPETRPTARSRPPAHARLSPPAHTVPSSGGGFEAERQMEEAAERHGHSLAAPHQLMINPTPT